MSGIQHGRRGVEQSPGVILRHAMKQTEEVDTLSFDEVRREDVFSIVADTKDMEETIAKIRDFFEVDHLVYHSSKRGASPSSDPYIRLTYPASWIKQYLQMGYIDVDPVLREGFLRAKPFDWSELKVQSDAEMAFLIDAGKHGVGPHGLSIPLVSKNGHRGLFSVSFSKSAREWAKFRADNLTLLIDVANRVHQRVVCELFQENRLHLTTREIECLSWIAKGKNSSDIAIILNISPYTVRDFLKSARFKLDCVSSAQAINKAVTTGLLVV